MFLKAPSRTILFKTEAPGIPLPPEPILTRWGTWINAASYYCQHFKEIDGVLQILDSNDAVSIKEAKLLLNENSIEASLVFIHSNYGFLTSTITQLERQDISLIYSISIVKSVQNKLNDVVGEVGDTINRKLNFILKKK